MQDVKSILDHSAILSGPSDSSQKLLAASTAIQRNSDPSEAAFMARYLLQCTLPHSNPGDIPSWQRCNGSLTLVIRPGLNYATNQTYGYPYGSLPRLLLFWIVTEAVRTKSRRLSLGSSLDEFIRAIGLSPVTGGGKRSDAKRLRDQMLRLFRSIISFQVSHSGPNRKGLSWLDMQVAPKGEMWWEVKQHSTQATLWESWIELGEDFYNAIIASPVPLDLRAIKALKRSPLALDLYAWAAYKVWMVNYSRSPQFIPWVGLFAQLGGDYDRLNNFVHKVKVTLQKVAHVFPSGLRFQVDSKGITFLPGAQLAIEP